MAALLLVAFLVLLGLVEARQGRPLAWDRALHAAAVDHRSAAVTGLAAGLSASAPPLAYVVAAVGGLLALRPRPWWVGALAGAAALAVGQLARLGLSVAIGRSRPPRGDWAAAATGYAFPSGHTTTVTVAAGILCLGLLRTGRRAARVGGSVVISAWALAVGTSRVVLGVHWPSDVIGGWLLGAAMTALLAVLPVPSTGTPAVADGRPGEAAES